jgi:hypothetical protein
LRKVLLYCVANSDPSASDNEEEEEEEEEEEDLYG